MSEEKKESTEESTKSDAEQQSDDQKKPDKIKKITYKVLTIVVLIFIWQLCADRITPYTDQARVQGLIVPIVPQVSGYITGINVRLGSIVDGGDKLFQIDKEDYLMAVKNAEAELDYSLQQIGALNATVKSFIAYREVARVKLERAQREFDRTKRVREQNPGALSGYDIDLVETALKQAVGDLAAAEADLERAKQQLGITGPNNPQLRAAVIKLEEAQMHLSNTTILAPSKGIIENFNVDIGHYSSVGTPLATFVSMSDAWIQADMRENNIGNIKAGDDVEFALDLAPGQIFEGKVRSVSWGVNSGTGSGRGDLISVSNKGGWLRQQQRFPVIIGMDEDAFKLIRSGGQVDVIVYTGGNFILNAIGWLQIRLNSWLSYVR